MRRSFVLISGTLVLGLAIGVYAVSSVWSGGAAVIKFQTAKLRRGCPDFARDRSSAGWSQIIAILQRVLPSARPVGYRREARWTPQTGAAEVGLRGTVRH